MKKILLLLLLILGSKTGFAQTNFRPGYVVPVSGDTLRGEVDNRGEEKNVISCLFRPNSASSATEYTPVQLKAYGFNEGIIYEAKQLPGTANAVAFLHVLVRGKLSLYGGFSTENKEVYYVSKEAGNVQLLVQKDTVLVKQGPASGTPARTMERIYPFRKLLWNLMADCPSVQVTVARLETKAQELSKAVDAYNKCGGGKSTYLETPRKGVNKFMLVGGLQRSAVVFRDDNQDKKMISNSPIFGVGFLLQPSRFNPKLSISFGALFVKHEWDENYSGIGSDGLSAGKPVQREVHIQRTTIQIPAQLRYSISQGVVRPFLQAGPIAMLHFGTDSYQIQTNLQFNNTYTTSYELRKYNLGAAVSAGVVVGLKNAGAIQLEARAAKMDGTSASNTRISGANNLELLAGFIFGK